MEIGVERDPSASVFRTSDITPRPRPRRTAPQRPTWGRGSLHTHPVPRARDGPGEQAQDDSPQTLGRRVAGTQPHLVPNPWYHSFLLPQPRPSPTGQNTDTGLDTFNGGIRRTGRAFPGLGWDGVAEEGVTFQTVHYGIPSPEGITPPLPFPPTAFQVLNPRTSHREDTHTVGPAKTHTVTQGV